MLVIEETSHGKESSSVVVSSKGDFSLDSEQLDVDKDVDCVLLFLLLFVHN